jgi:Arc/MetJ family transcription regulator
MKTTIDVDREVADRVARLLKTRSLKDTVNAALREVLSASKRHELAARVRARSLPAPTPEELARLRAPQVPVGGLSFERKH